MSFLDRLKALFQNEIIQSLLSKKGLSILATLFLTSVLSYSAFYFLNHKNVATLTLHPKGQKIESKNQKDSDASLNDNNQINPKQHGADPRQNDIGKNNAHDSEKETAFPSLTCQNNINKITFIVKGLGLDTALTDRAIRELPRAVVLSFSSYAKMINQWIQPARAAGHQLLLEVSNESDSENISILTYFDGIYIVPGKPPVTNPKTLTAFVEFIADKQKILVEGRLIAKNHLAREAKRQNFPIFYVSQSLTAESVVVDKQDLLSQKGIVAISASLVPYLIDYLNKKDPKDIQLSPLTPYDEKQ